MRRMFAYMAFILMLCTLVGCSNSTATPFDASNMPYEILEENGKYYLLMKAPNFEATPDIENAYEAAPMVFFSSVEEMVNDISTGNFSNDELENLSRFRKDEQGRIQIFNQDEWFIPVAPSPFKLRQIRWCDDSCKYVFSEGNKSPTLGMKLCTREEYEENVDSWVNFAARTTAEVLSVTIEEKRNATVTHIVNMVGDEYIDVYYSVTEGSKTLHFRESYDLKVSADVPKNVFFCGIENGVYFMGNVHSLNERPTVEWLSQFGLREYVETEVA